MVIQAITLIQNLSFEEVIEKLLIETHNMHMYGQKFGQEVALAVQL